MEESPVLEASSYRFAQGEFELSLYEMKNKDPRSVFKTFVLVQFLFVVIFQSSSTFERARKGTDTKTRRNRDGAVIDPLRVHSSSF